MFDLLFCVAMVFQCCNRGHIPSNHSSGCSLFLPTSWRESIKLGSCQIESGIPGKLAYLLPEFPETIPRTSESLFHIREHIFHSSYFLIIAHHLHSLCFSTTMNQFQVKQGLKWGKNYFHKTEFNNYVGLTKLTCSTHLLCN